MSSHQIFQLTVLTLFLGPCGERRTVAESADIMHPLQLTVDLPASPILLQPPITVTATLTNRGQEPALVNRRLAVGYEEGLSRELYARIRRLDGGTEAPYTEVDINRDFPTAGDYGLLPPGDSLQVGFDLLQYYPIRQPGRYEVIFFYQADEPMAGAPAGIVDGVVASAPAVVEIARPNGR